MTPAVGGQRYCGGGNHGAGHHGIPCEVRFQLGLSPRGSPTIAVRHYSSPSASSRIAYVHPAISYSNYTPVYRCPLGAGAVRAAFAREGAQVICIDDNAEMKNARLLRMDEFELPYALPL